jgi:hypothetical protein
VEEVEVQQVAMEHPLEAVEELQLEAVEEALVVSNRKHRMLVRHPMDL